jgi:predicted amidophosphoribosyltransferase
VLRGEWAAALEREGVAPVACAIDPDADEPPCPACGTQAPLVRGACADCGLQLE